MGQPRQSSLYACASSSLPGILCATGTDYGTGLSASAPPSRESAQSRVAYRYWIRAVNAVGKSAFSDRLALSFVTEFQPKSYCSSPNVK